MLYVPTARHLYALQRPQQARRSHRMKDETKRPMADPGRVEDALSLFPFREMPPSEYAARYAHTIGCSSFDMYEYPDRALGAWIDEVHRLLRSPGEVERCRRAHLTADEYAQVQREEELEF
jgi:hypothetical protein